MQISPVRDRSRFPNAVKVVGVVASLLIHVPGYGKAYTLTGKGQFETYANGVDIQRFDAPTPGTISGATIPYSDLDHHFDVTIENHGVLAISAGSERPDIGAIPTRRGIPWKLGQTLLFSNSHQTETSPAVIRFHNFNGKGRSINAFGFTVIDFGTGTDEGNQLKYRTDTGEEGVLLRTEGVLDQYNVQYAGVITTKAFKEISLYTTAADGMIWFDNVSFGRNGVNPPLVTSDVIEKFRTLTFCPGSPKAVALDLDGVNNGTRFDPDETLLVIEQKMGQGTTMEHRREAGNLVYEYTHSLPICPGREGGRRSVFVMRFVDMRDQNFDVDDSDTWAFTTVPKVSLDAWKDEVSAAAPDGYSQIKAYKTVAEPQVPGNLINGSPGQEASREVQNNMPPLVFEDRENGVAELLFRSDYAYNWVDDVRLTGPAGNTPLGKTVAVDLSPAHVTFAEVKETGITDIRVTSRPAAQGNILVSPVAAAATPGSGRLFAVHTTADVAGPIAVCFDIEAPALRLNPHDRRVPGLDLKVFHFESGNWVDVTSLTQSDRVCGEIMAL